MIFFKVEDGL